MCFEVEPKSADHGVMKKAFDTVRRLVIISNGGDGPLSALPAWDEILLVFQGNRRGCVAGGVVERLQQLESLAKFAALGRHWPLVKSEGTIFSLGDVSRSVT